MSQQSYHFRRKGEEIDLLLDKASTAIQEVKTINGVSIVGKGNIQVSAHADSELSDTSTNAIQNKVVSQALKGKVEKEDGKGLSTEDFTTQLKSKLNSLENYDDIEIKKQISSKVDKVEGKQLTTEDFTTPLKSKLEGAENYDEVLAVKEQVADETKKVIRKINYIGLTDNQALSVKELYPKWEDKVNLTIEAGYITLYNDKLWRARQTHTAMEIYPPSLETASLYEVIVKEHEGTMEDPIPYTPPMEIFEGKYYTQYDVLYKCTRDSGTALSHDLYDIRGLYVELVD